jgi:hypothetical protein
MCYVAAPAAKPVLSLSKEAVDDFALEKMAGYFLFCKTNPNRTFSQLEDVHHVEDDKFR